MWLENYFIFLNVKIHVPFVVVAAAAATIATIVMEW